MSESATDLFERRDVRWWTLIAIVPSVLLTYLAAPAGTPWYVDLLGGISLGLIAMMSVFAPRMIGGDDFI